MFDIVFSLLFTHGFHNKIVKKALSEFIIKHRIIYKKMQKKYLADSLVY